MSDELAEVSANAASLIREGLTESRKAVIRAQELVDGIRTKPVVQDGTRESLKTLSAKLGEAEELYVKVFSQITKTYGDHPEQEPSGGASLPVTPDEEE